MLRQFFSMFTAFAIIFYFSGSPTVFAADDDDYLEVIELELDEADDFDDFDDEDFDEFDDDEDFDDDDFDDDYTEQNLNQSTAEATPEPQPIPEPQEPLKVNPVANNYVRVAVITDTPGGNYSEPEAIYNSTKKLMKEILADQPELQMLPLENVDAYVQIYREENNIDVAMADGVADRAVKPALKRRNLNELGDFLKAKYIFYIRVTTSLPQKSEGFIDAGRRANVSTDFRIWSQDKKNFVYAKRYMATGSSKTYFRLFSGGSPYHAVNKGTSKAFNRIRADLYQIRASMQ